MSLKIYDLSQPFGFMMPLWPMAGRSNVALQRVVFHEAGLKRGTIYTGSLRTGTHMDAPIHSIDCGTTLIKVLLENCFGTGGAVDFRCMRK